ncbi:GNS1-SUR4 family protein [Pyrenophora teres f. maculata]|nr:GNS1-SUR4 family protein [Pyrenophora teres f. maculata]
MSGAGPSLHPGDWPSRAVLQFPPDAAPLPIPPPWTGESTFANPFPIPEDIYQGALSYKVPLTIASVYFVTVTYVNWYNRQHGNKPWRIAKTRPFYAFVIFHNVFLAVYSAVTCVAMIRCLKHSFPHYSEPNAVVGTIDALCKIHGPRGLGDAVTYRANNDTWASLNPNVLVGPNGMPDTSDVGRIWNEGLAFWGWWFYLSKFYEVLDTAIILAKGKRSTTLQKYHHAGAMLSMWAGMRFMSPPIWMFALVNSGIHAMMYTYYTVSALGFRVPNIVKRTLTTLQITQFLVGSAFAAIHLFVSYTVPVSVAYKVAEKVAPKLSSTVSSVVASATESVAEALPTATGAAVAFLRKLIYRAAGDEGLAENIPVPGHPVLIRQQQEQVVVNEPAPVQNAVHDFFHPHETVEKIYYRNEYQTVPCVDTSGQAFAIYVNLIYLAPLTILFMRFFFKSYLRRSSPNTKRDSKPRTISDAAGDASRRVERELDSLDKSAEDAISSGVNIARDAVRGRRPANGQIKDERQGSMSPANQKFLENVNRRVSEKLQELDEGADATSEKARQIAKDLVGKVEDAGDVIEAEYTNGRDNASQRSASNARKPNKKGSHMSLKSQRSESVARPEQEPEPKDINNTLDEAEGKGKF